MSTEGFNFYYKLRDFNHPPVRRRLGHHDLLSPSHRMKMVMGMAWAEDFNSKIGVPDRGGGQKNINHFLFLNIMAQVLEFVLSKAAFLLYRLYRALWWPSHA